jgi:hypothetical protein
MPGWFVLLHDLAEPFRCLFVNAEAVDPNHLVS